MLTFLPFSMPIDTCPAAAGFRCSTAAGSLVGSVAVDRRGLAYRTGHQEGTPHFMRPPETMRRRVESRTTGRKESEVIGPPSRAATRWPRPERDGSTISASGGQGRGVVWVATFPMGGGSHRWLTKWLTLLTTPTLLSQRAKSSPSWSRLCPETLIGSGLARIPRVLCGKA